MSHRITDQWLDAALGIHIPDRTPTGSAREVADSAGNDETGTGGADPAGTAAVEFANRVTRTIGCTRPVNQAAGGPRSDAGGEALLAARTNETGPVRQSRISRNGTSRLFRTADGWISLSISRTDDVDLLAACFETDPIVGDPWKAVEHLAADQPSVHIRDRAALVGLSCAIPDEHRSAALSARNLTDFSGSSRPRRPPRVIDLSALWAGPLCAHLLGRTGADVTTIEDPNRPDGTRIGSPGLYRTLHDGHRLEHVVLHSATGRARLLELIGTADVVITSARPRALEQLGVDPHELMRRSSITAWISITGFGLAQPQRAGFGDDAAVAGGLYNQSPDGPVFTADAVGDPLTGIAGAAIALHALRTSTRVHADLSLAGVAALVAKSVPDPLIVSPPASR